MGVRAMGNCCSDSVGGKEAVGGGGGGTAAGGNSRTEANEATDLFLRSRGYTGLYSQIEVDFVIIHSSFFRFFVFVVSGALGLFIGICLACSSCCGIECCW